MLLLVMLNVGIRKIIAGEGRVQEADLVFVEDPLELVGETVEDLDHIPDVLVSAADTTHSVIGVTLIASPLRVMIIKETLPLLPGLHLLQKLPACLLCAVSPDLRVEL